MSTSGAVALHDASHADTGASAASRGRSVRTTKWTLKRKMWLTLALMWVVMIGIVFSMALQNRDVMYEERQQALSSTIGMVHTLLDGYAGRVESGELSTSEAQQLAVDDLDAMRFGANRSNYVFVFDEQADIVYHPRRDAGSDMSDYQDPKGVAVYRELATLAGNGGGFLHYHSLRSKDDGSSLLSKVSYVERFQPWGWNMAAGVYTDDIQAAFYKKLGQYTIILLIAGGALTAAFLLLIKSVYRSLGGEPKLAASVVSHIAQGDLTQPTALRQGDESSLMYEIERMRLELSAMIARIRQSSESIDTGTSDIAQGNNDLSARTEQQAASLAETASSMEELTATVRQNAENAGHASQLSSHTTESVASGQKTISQVVTAMGEIRESSEEIANIITMIDDITFQTNLLALNASVEAARAGEQGCGFAVVASEVRNLAGRSASAARDIRTLIERSTGQVESGVKLVDQADAGMVDIRDSAQKVTDLMKEISAASNEQSSGIEQVNQAVSQMDQVTQQNASLVQQAAAAASSLEAQSADLYRTVGHFRVPANA